MIFESESARHELQLPKLIAHRGASLSAPENTLASLIKAKEMGAKWVEFDVRLTHDKKAIIMHDDTLDRTTNGEGLIADFDFSEIKDLDAGSWFDRKYRGESIPTLSQYLQVAAKLSLGINVELKATESQAQSLVSCVLKTLKQYWPEHLPTPLISSGSQACLVALKHYYSSYFYGYILSEWSDDWKKIMKTLSCISLHVDYQYLNIERVAAIKICDKKVLAYTVDEEPIAQSLFDMGVDAIFSNNPKLLNNQRA